MYGDKGQVGDLYVSSNVKEEKPKIQRNYTNINFTISINYTEVILAPQQRL
jgi:DnaJ-class molecular chaperone